MYAIIRRYAGKGSLMDKLAPKVRDELVPMLRQAPGFRRYCALPTEDGDIVSISLFDDQASAEAAHDKARQWVAASLKEWLPDPPEVVAGEVRRDMSQPGQGGMEGMHVVIRQYAGVRSIEKLVAMAEEHVMPVLRASPGLLGHYVLLTPGQGVVAMSAYDSREHAIRANDQVIGIMREKAKDLVPDPPRVTMGRAAVVASAP